jgi:hypothetical protein
MTSCGLVSVSLHYKNPTLIYRCHVVWITKIKKLIFIKISNQKVAKIWNSATQEKIKK